MSKLHPLRNLILPCPGNECSTDESEQRTLDEPGPRIEFDIGSDGRYVTKSGSNQFRGNVYNGSKLSAANYFTNATPGNHKPRSTVNHFGGSAGGPIMHDKLFFLFDSEWVRIALPIVTAATVPTPAFQNYVLQQHALGWMDSVTGSVYQPFPQSVPFYQKMFSLYGNTNVTPLTVLGCPFDVGGVAPAIANDGNGCANKSC